MIKVKPYPNELIYSIIARTQDRLQYANKATFMREILIIPKTIPSILFTNKYTDLQLQRLDPLEKYIHEHTLFDTFATTIPKSDRDMAYQLILNQDSSFSSFLHLPRPKVQFTYCPLCAKEHRQLYGETYWDKTCFIPNLTICPIHKCYLTVLDLKKYSGYYLANDIIPLDEKISICTDKSLLSLSDTIINTSHFVPDNNFILKNFLNYHLTNYKKGCILQIGQLIDDMQKFFQNQIFEREAIHNVILGRRWNFQDVCLLLNFLQVNISNEYEDLTIVKTDDTEIYQLVADEIGVSLEIVMKVSDSLRKYTISTSRTKVDYNSLDEKYLEKVRLVCENFLNCHQRVTYSAVRKALGLPEQQLEKHLPKCRAIVDEYRQTNDEWRVTKLLYVCDEIKENGFTITELISRTGIQKSLLKRTVDMLEDDCEYKKRLKELLNGFC